MNTSSKKQGKIFVVRNDACWNRGDEDGGSGCKGYIEDDKTEGFVRVKWLTTNISRFYSFGSDGIFEVVEFTDDKSNCWLCSSSSNWNSPGSFKCEACGNEGSSRSESNKFRSKSFVEGMLFRPLSSNDRHDSFRIYEGSRSKDIHLSLDTSFISSGDLSEISLMSTPPKDAAGDSIIESPGSLLEHGGSFDLFRSKSEDFGDANDRFEVNNITVIKRICKVFPQACQRTDRAGRLPLHYACRNNVPMDVLQMIFEGYCISNILV